MVEVPSHPSWYLQHAAVSIIQCLLNDLQDSNIFKGTFAKRRVSLDRSFCCCYFRPLSSGQLQLLPKLLKQPPFLFSHPLPQNTHFSHIELHSICHIWPTVSGLCWFSSELPLWIQYSVRETPCNECSFFFFFKPHTYYSENNKSRNLCSWDF